MDYRSWKWKWVLVPIALMCAMNLASAQRQPGAKAPSPVAWKPVVTGNAQDYIGVEACAECHTQVSTQFSKTSHARGDHGADAYASGCESCHGPGRAHVEGMRAAQGDDDRILAAMQLVFSFRGSADENSARCLSCHVTSHDQTAFANSEHKLRGLDCQTCHSAHLTGLGEGRSLEPVRSQPALFISPRPVDESRWLNSSLLRKPQPELCYSCHKVIEGQFALPSHHRVPEGLMTCTDCHNPHGTRNQVMLKKTNWEACVDCHIEKRGPFVFEHAPVKAEGCAACHSPHGNVNRMLLLRREGRFICLQCHVDPQAPNVPHGRLGFTTRGECIRCHAAIHGSHFSRYFLD